MKKLFFLLISISITSCATKQEEQISVTGKRISKEDAKKLNLRPIGTIQDLIQSERLGIPEPSGVKDCKDLLEKLKIQEVKIDSIEAMKVVVFANNGKRVTYSFKDGSCLQ